MPGLPDIMPAMLAGMETYDSDFSTGELANTYNVQQVSLEDYVRNTFAPT
jgi:hypothetical protein